VGGQDDGRAVSSIRVAVLGVAGMLGHKLFQQLRERFSGTIGITRTPPTRPPLDKVAILQGADVLSGFDANDFAEFRRRLQNIAPDVIVNCIGLIKQRPEATSPIPNIRVNALFPHLLAEAAQTWGGHVIHFGTDCVFSGRSGNYREDDPSDAEDLYGKTKFLGEVTTSNAATLRTSIIGRELTDHQSLLEWLLSQNGKRIRGYRRVIYSGITTNEMANVVTRTIEKKLSGRFHVVSKPITKFDLLSLITNAYGLDIEIEPDDAIASDRSMSDGKFEAATGWRAPSWPEMVQGMADDPTPYREWGVSVL